MEQHARDIEQKVSIMCRERERERERESVCERERWSVFMIMSSAILVCRSKI